MKIKIATFLLASIFVCILSANNSYALRQVDPKDVLKEREAEKDKYLNSKALLLSDSSRATMRIIVDNAESLLAKDQIIIADYELVNDSLKSLSKKLDNLSIKTLDFEKELSEKTKWMFVLMIGAILIFILMIIFLVLFNSRNSKLKKISEDLIQLTSREDGFNEKILELQKELEQIRVDAEKRIVESEKKSKEELKRLIESETELKSANLLLEKQLTSVKQNENDFIAKESELKELLNNELQRKIQYEEQINLLTHELEIAKTQNNIDDYKGENDALKNEINALLERLTREAQVKEQLENQLMELKALIDDNINNEDSQNTILVEKLKKEKDEMQGQIFELKQQFEESKKMHEKVEANIIEQNELSQILEEKNKLENEKNELLQIIAKQNEIVEDETSARKLLEQEFYKILEEIKSR